MEREQFLEVYRHSLSHILAKAIIEIFGKENVQYAIGPQIADGFYYDFILPRTITKDDFPQIEQKMREILKRKEDWTRKEVSRQEALDIFKDQKFKTELIQDLPEDEKITIYYTGDDYVDLCTGPHVDNSAELLSAAFQIKSASGSYWRGDEKREQLQRIYVYAFPDKKQLKEHLHMIEEAMKRDHKKLGKEQRLFMFDPSAPGMPFWLPRGWKMYNALLDFWRQVHRKHGYMEISGPVLSSKEIWETSGHWGHYQENMFIIPAGNEEGKIFAAKPMNCPNAILVYKNDVRSYKDLPFRISQVDVIHRREKSGELNGLLRVQEFRQDDAHILLAEEQVADEISDIMKVAHELYDPFGLTFSAELSTRPDDYMGDLEVWNHAEAEMKENLDRLLGPGNYEINEGDGAFYGPKIDMKMTDSLGREWQLGTIQLDFQLPLNFDCKYTAADGTQKMPVMLHRAMLGSFERFIGILIEDTACTFPFWLCPEQVAVVPIRQEHNEYAKQVADKLEAAGFRVDADYTDKNMKEKIKHFKNFKDPYILVLGGQEAENGTVSVNVRGSNKQLHGVPLEKFIEVCQDLQKNHVRELAEEF